ncbi:MAG: hypothetical protein KAR17_02720 [Cyclobacteriaceae bacterium]|nr:hypothetical protein [Cyclobacteriaceae bacterium]
MMASFMATLLFCLFIPMYVHAKIINGYSKELKGVQSAITNLEILIRDPELPKWKRHVLKKKIRDLVLRKQNCSEYYFKTQSLIDRLKQCDPVLYNEIATIVDAQGNLIDVYVSIVSPVVLPQGVCATTNLNCCKENKQIYVSEFGLKTVCVRIRESRKDLFNLVHEFGHVRYQVPNLESYMDFYMKNYYDTYLQNHGYYIGHKTNDPSHQSVMFVMDRYRELIRKKEK